MNRCANKFAHLFFLYRKALTNAVFGNPHDCFYIGGSSFNKEYSVQACLYGVLPE
jgi:hypothetical protein